MSLVPLTELILQRRGKLRPPVSQPFLDFSIPQDYTDFLRACDGMEDMDDSGWRFWGYSELRPLDQMELEGSIHSIPPECECCHDFIVFADHLIEMGFLCFRVRPPSATTPIFYFFGFGALYPVAAGWHDLHYALQNETSDFPYLEASCERLARRVQSVPLPSGGV